jgi:steroid delta-isomerase-like uncharacterized protein
MSQANRAVLDRLNEEALNGGNADVLDELLTDDFVEHNPMPGTAPDRQGFKELIHSLHTGFPDFHTDVLDQIAEGDRVVERWTVDGTHQGEFMGIPATGRRVHFEGMDISRLQDGRLVEHWTQMDALTMMQQLGAIPDEQPTAG